MNLKMVAHSMAFAALAAFAAWSAPAAEIGNDGGITLTASFEIDDEIDSSIMPPLDDPLAKGHYCAAVQEFSEKLYALTEGAHWIRRVRFLEQANEADIRWRYISDPADYTFSYGSFRNWLKVNERGTTDPDPYASPPHSTSGLGWLLLHEFGHFFYGLTDEYISRDVGAGRTGFCGDGSYGQSFDDDGNLIGSGITCDEEALQCGGAPCVFFGQCIAGEAPIGKECNADLVDPFDPPDYGGGCGGGTCLGSREDRADKPEKKRICLAETDLSVDTGDEALGVCLMTGGGLRERWCDGNHVHTLDDAQEYGVDVAFDMGDIAGPSDGSDGNKDWQGHSCWAQAAGVHADLAGVHTELVYPSLAEIVAEEGPVPPVDCDWFIDGLGGGAHAVLLVDRSGSMSYADEGFATAVDLARDGALYFYNETDNGDFVGVSVYNTAVVPAETGGVDLVFAQKAGDIGQIDAFGAGGDTDIALALDTAFTEIVSTPGVPLANRNIVVFSDGKSNQGGDPQASAQVACDKGVTVHTIAYGNADSDALDQMACSGHSWVSGTVEENGLDFGEPDPVEIKSSIARIQHYISGEDEIHEHIADLDALTESVVEEISFTVPEETPGMVFSWLGNRACVLIVDGQETRCDPVLNHLVRLELEDPDGAVYPAGLSAAETAGVYRTVTVADPRAGNWIARIDKTEPIIPGLIPGEWEARVPETRVSWVAFVDNPDLEGAAWTSPRRAPVDYPVVILGQMTFRTLATNISVEATVSHAGNLWTVPMFDDGAHGDGARRDGVYGGYFNPDGNWPNVDEGGYRVKVRMGSEEGLAMGIGFADSDIELEAGAIQRPGTAFVEAETSFRLGGRYGVKRNGEANPGAFGFVCPNLEREKTTFLTATLIGMAATAADARIVLGGDLEIATATFNCQNCTDTGTDPVTALTFFATPDADATLGLRPLRVQVGEEIVESTQLCRVCASPACDEIELAMGDLVSGEVAELTVTGAAPGETVRFIASGRGTGMGPCPPALGGLCVDLQPPVKPIGVAVADELGRAVLELAVPAVSGVTLYAQAVIQRGPGGVDSVKSGVVRDFVDP